MTDIAHLKELNASRWQAAKLTRQSEYTLPVSRALAAKPRYLQISQRTGVHWVFIAVTHYRECSQNFSESLAQGDPWNKRSTHVPAGRGPFASFEDAAVDALVNCAPYAARIKTWTLPDMLTLLEMYNGLKYANAGVPSPYVWSGTDQYKIGKVIVDHGPIEPVVDKQLGVAGFILCLEAADTSIHAAPPPPLVIPNPTVRPPGIIDEVWEWIKKDLGIE